MARRACLDESRAAVVHPGSDAARCDRPCRGADFAILGGAALLLFWRAGTPIAAVALEHYRMVVNPSLPAIPLFTLAGFGLAAGGAPARLTRLFRALFGHLRGGVAIAAVVVGAFFTALTGGSGVTILALGGVLFPLLVAARYPERDAVGLVTVSGSLGTLVAPCLPLVLYAIVAKVDTPTCSSELRCPRCS